MPKKSKCPKMSRGVGYNPNQEIKFKLNRHILRWIIEATILRAEQKILLSSLREHSEKNSNPNECRQRPPNKGSFLAIIKCFSKHEKTSQKLFLTALVMHNIFSTHSKRNYCFIWGICPRGRIREFLQSIVYYSLIADELFGSYVNKKLLLLSLRFLQNIGKNVIVQESLLDSVQHLTFRQQKKILQSVYQIC